jgi:hypothetical protein
VNTQFSDDESPLVLQASIPTTPTIPNSSGYTYITYVYIYSHCIPISPKKSTIKLDVIPHQSIVISGVSPCFTATSKISKTLCQAEERSQAEALAEHHAGSIRFSDEKHWKNPWAVGMYI